MYLTYVTRAVMYMQFLKLKNSTLKISPPWLWYIYVITNHNATAVMNTKNYFQIFSNR